jgi:hypothetical protein
VYIFIWDFLGQSNLYIFFQVVFESKKDIYVFLHHPGQYLDVNSKTKLPGNVGSLLFIDIVYEVC